MKFYGQLEKAGFEVLSSDPAQGTAGRFWFNSTSTQFKIDDGTNIRAVLRNDQKCVFGNSGTAGSNIRFNRAGAGLLQLVTGADTTAEGSLSTAVAQISMRVENWTTGTAPAAGNAGRLYFATDTTTLFIDTGASWLVAGFANPLTTGGDIMYGGSSGSPTRLANGSVGQMLESEGSTNAPTWKYPGGYRNVTNTNALSYNILLTDQTVTVNIAGATITLPSASANPNKTYKIVQTAPTALASVSAIGVTGGGGSIVYRGSTVSTVHLATSGEMWEFQSDATNWVCISHECDTLWIADTSCIQNYYTFTITSGSATIAATYTPAFVFTVTPGNTASVGAIFSNNGINYTLAQALLVGDATAIFTGSANPTANGTLTYVSGTHTGGNIAFSAFTGQDTTTFTFTVAKTVASGVQLITQSNSVNTANASGKLVKASGTGDAVITYSAVSGISNRIADTGTLSVFYGSPTVNTSQWRRRGNEMTLWLTFYQATAGAVAGTGDYIFPMPAGATIDTSILAAADTSVLAATTDFIELPAKTQYFTGNTASGRADSAPAYYQFLSAVPYSTTSFRIYGALDGATDPNYPFSPTQISAASIMAYQFQVTFPILNWEA